MTARTEGHVCWGLSSSLYQIRVRVLIKEGVARSMRRMEDNEDVQEEEEEEEEEVEDDEAEA